MSDGDEMEARDDWKKKATPASYRPSHVVEQKAIDEAWKNDPAFPGRPPMKPPPPPKKKSDGETKRGRQYVLFPAPAGRAYGWQHIAAPDDYRGPWSTGFRFVLPLPPSKNDLTGARAFFANGKPIVSIYESTVSKAYKKLIAEAFTGDPRDVAPDVWQGAPPKFPAGEMLWFSRNVFYPRAGADLLNRDEAGFDALIGIAYEDDKQLAEHGAGRRFVDPSWPRWELTIMRSDLDAYGRRGE